MGMANDKQGDDGKFVASYDPEEFVAAVEGLEMPGTSDVADEVDAPHRTALHHLNQLEEEGRLTSKMVGRSKIWSLNKK